MSLLLDEDDVLWSLYEGWQHYRTYLDQRPNLKGNQIDKWNGQWLGHSFDSDFEVEHPWDGFNIELIDKDGEMEIPPFSWVRSLFALAQHYPQKTILAYVWKLGIKTNNTVGFVPLQLGEVYKICDLEDKLFLFPKAVRSEGRDKLRSLYITHYGFARACQLGAIGLAAIEPAKLRDYLPSAYGPAKPPSLKTEAAAIQNARQRGRWYATAPNGLPAARPALPRNSD